jgi:hypothetical protein
VLDSAVTVTTVEVGFLVVLDICGIQVLVDVIGLMMLVVVVVVGLAVAVVVRGQTVVGVGLIGDVGLVKVTTVVTTVDTDEVVVVGRVLLYLVTLVLLAGDLLATAVNVEAPLPTSYARTSDISLNILPRPSSCEKALLSS